MKEIREIIKAYDEAQAQGRRTALATVVHVEGSSYRRPGARMLVRDDGQLTGAISGGCLEGDALRKSLLAITENKNMLVTYDTNDEDDAIIGMGLGCNGIIRVLIEPVNPDNSNNPVEWLRKVAAKREEAVLVTLFSLEDRKSLQPGTCLLVKPGNIIDESSSPIRQQLVAEAMEALQVKQSFFKEDETTGLNAFIEFILPSIALVIAGAGNDIIPLVQIAQLLGWETTVVDGRGNYAKQERFPGCQVLLSKPKEVLKHIAIDSQTVFALMTHNYNYDKAMLRELLLRNVTYIGLLGPKKKKDRLLQELADEGLHLSESHLKSIHGPVGLDIGAETPEEIALSIAAEIKAVLSGKKVHSLKYNDRPIHDSTYLNAYTGISRKDAK